MSDTPSNNKPRTVSPIPNVTASESSGGGAGQTPVWGNPDIVMSAPAGQHINLLAQANAALMVKSGISLFTYRKASNPKKPNQEVGIMPTPHGDHIDLWNGKHLPGHPPGSSTYQATLDYFGRSKSVLFWELK